MEARRPSSMSKPKTHITDPTKDAPEGAAWTLCGLFVLREQVDTDDPSCLYLGWRSKPSVRAR